MGRPADVIKYYSEIFNNINTEMELQNRVASLSNHSVTIELMRTIKQISYISTESNHEMYCMYLKSAIKDLISSMDAVEMLWKYDNILYSLKNKNRLEKINIFLKEIHWYEQCDKNNGDKCEHCRCQYSVLHNGKNNFTCGRIKYDH